MASQNGEDDKPTTVESEEDGEVNNISISQEEEEEEYESPTKGSYTKIYLS